MKRRTLVAVIVAYGLGLTLAPGQGEGPDWWFTRNVVLTNMIGSVNVRPHYSSRYPANYFGAVFSNAVDGNVWQYTWYTYTTNAASSNDYAQASIGQIKWMAHQSAVQVKEQLGWVGPAIIAMTNRFSLSNNFVAANIGQVKNAAMPFYNRLSTAGFTNLTPAWTTNTSADDRDYAPVNIGQVKHAFDGIGRALEPLWGWVERMDGTAVTFQVTNQMIFNTRYVFGAVTNGVTNGEFRVEGIVADSTNAIRIGRFVQNVWINPYTIEWFQDRDLTATRLFHRVRQKGVAGSNSVVFDARTVPIEYSGTDMDREYISARPDRSMGWGVPPGVMIRETNHFGTLAVGPVLHDAALRLDMATKPSGDYAFEAVGLKAEGVPEGPLYLVRWQPRFTMRASAEYLPLNGEPVVVTVESDSHPFSGQVIFKGKLVADPPGSVVFVDGSDTLEFELPGSAQAKILAADTTSEPITISLMAAGSAAGVAPLAITMIPGGYIATEIMCISGVAYPNCNEGWATGPMIIYVECWPGDLTGTLNVWAGAINGVLITNIPSFSGNIGFEWDGGSLKKMPPEIFAEWNSACPCHRSIGCRPNP